MQADKQDWEMRRATDGTVAVRRAGQLGGELVHTYPADWTAQELTDYLAAGSAQLDTARARIALLEARLNALCGAVEVCRDDNDLEWLDVFDSNVAALLSATQAAREVLGG